MRVFNSYLTQTFKNKEVEVIFDVGACHALESVELSKNIQTQKYIRLKQIQYLIMFV